MCIVCGDSRSVGVSYLLPILFLAYQSCQGVPNVFNTMVTSKRSRVRRSHVLGGCSTCRRRHVKCDQKRPACKTCKLLGVTCEGFSDQVLWMRGDDDGDELEGGRRGTRRHLYSGKISFRKT